MLPRTCASRVFIRQTKGKCRLDIRFTRSKMHLVGNVRNIDVTKTFTEYTEDIIDEGPTQDCSRAFGNTWSQRVSGCILRCLLCPAIALLCYNPPNCGLATGPLPPDHYGIDMRDWGGIPTDDEKSRVRAAGVQDSGKPRGEYVRC